ncbi:MAG: hypothetical protein JXA18_06665 [Chitinispirillaceae bacterium]|nr:hypothetical protein [Chitinispirillaceae bacterium]
MKRNITHSALVSIVIVATAIASGPAEIDYDSLAGYAVVGPPTVPILKIIKDIDQLASYCDEARCDTSLISPMPDFTTRTVIGLLAMTGGGNRVSYRYVRRIVDTGDTVILEIRPDSQVFDPGISIQAAYNVLLLAIPKTDKPIVLRESPLTSIDKPLFHAPAIMPVQQASGSRYDLRGRSLPGRNVRRTGLIVSVNVHGKGKVLSFAKRRLISP